MRTNRPPYGLCLPCKVVRVIDGDTVEVKLPRSAYQWKLRLANCWCAEMNTEAGRVAKASAEQFVNGADCSVYIPAPKDVKNLLKNLTFDRIPAYLFINDELTLNEAMVLGGFASTRKGGELGT